MNSFLELFIPDEHRVIMGLLRDVTWNIISANSIYPKNESEYQATFNTMVVDSIVYKNTKIDL